jgi:hypothetical protein
VENLYHRGLFYGTRDLFRRRPVGWRVAGLRWLVDLTDSLALVLVLLAVV